MRIQRVFDVHKISLEYCEMSGDDGDNGGDDDDVGGGGRWG